jgi:hypothetical protein
LINHYDKIIAIRIEIGKQELLEKVSLKMQSDSTDKFKSIRRIIEILKLLEDDCTNSEIKEEIIDEEITDDVLISIAQCENASLINEFYEHATKDSDLLEQTEQIFIEKLPFDSNLKKEILDRKEKVRKARIEAEKKEKERLKKERKVIALFVIVIAIIYLFMEMKNIWASNPLF